MTSTRRPGSVALVLTTPVPAAPGGGERYVQELARALGRLIDTRVHVLVTRESVVDENWGGARRHRVRAVPSREGFRLAVSPSLMREASTADVVHVHQYGTLTSHALAAVARRRGASVFSTDHGSSGMGPATRLGLTKLFDGFLEVSQFAASFAPRPHEVIYGGVDADRFSPGQRATEPFALFVGRLLPHKGLDWLVEAMPAHHRLIIAGRPDEQAHPGYLESLRRKSAGKRIEWRLGADDAAIIDLYREAAVACLPSVHRPADGSYRKMPELLGLTVLEAMACGTPTVVSAVGSMPELVQTGRTGRTVSENDRDELRSALAGYLDDPVRSREDGRRAREAVLSEFTWHRVARRCVDAYAAEADRQAAPRAGRAHGR